MQKSYIDQIYTEEGNIIFTLNNFENDKAYAYFTTEEGLEEFLKDHEQVIVKDYRTEDA